MAVPFRAPAGPERGLRYVFVGMEIATLATTAGYAYAINAFYRGVQEGFPFPLTEYQTMLLLAFVSYVCLLVTLAVVAVGFFLRGRRQVPVTPSRIGLAFTLAGLGIGVVAHALTYSPEFGTRGLNLGSIAVLIGIGSFALAIMALGLGLLAFLPPRLPMPGPPLPSHPNP